jgi:hypothetical protein
MGPTAGEHPVARSHQRSHEQAPVRLGRDHDAGRILAVLGHQRMEPRDPLHPVRQPHLRELSTLPVLHVDVVMILCPVMFYEQRLHGPPDRGREPRRPAAP